MILFATTDEIARISRFGIAGIFITMIDFAIFNALSGRVVHLGKIQANTVSTTVAMIFSFLVNRSFVFQGQGNEFQQAVLFFVFTAFGLYVLQNGVIYLLTEYLKWPRKLVTRLTHSRHIPLEPDFVLKNGAKLTGTVVSLIWNYLLYGRIVFRGKV
ncbi:MAG: GtrA family protein [Candidatus Saccharibacteria bacterium]